MSQLQVDLHVSSRPPVAVPPREGREWLWSGISNTLIHDDKFALLVDTSITVEQNSELVDWIKSVLGPARSLTHLFITHGHQDHYLGVPTLQDAFPNLKVLATAGTIHQMKDHNERTVDVWPTLFPNGQLDPRQDWTADALPADGKFEIESTAFRAIEVEQGDCAHASVLHVPELDLVCAGDVVIATHLYLTEANTAEKRKLWLEALDQIDELKPQIVVPGHMRAGQLPLAKVMVKDTRKYILAWEEELARSNNSEEMFENMSKRYPGRYGHFVLQSGSDAAFLQ